MLLGDVVPVMDLQVLESCQGFQIRPLALRLIRVAGFSQYSGGEVSNCDQFLAGVKQVFSQAAQVKPVVATPTFGLKAIVEIEAVDVCCYTLNRHYALHSRFG